MESEQTKRRNDVIERKWRTKNVCLGLIKNGKGFCTLTNFLDSFSPSLSLCWCGSVCGALIIVVGVVEIVIAIVKVRKRIVGFLKARRKEQRREGRKEKKYTKINKNPRQEAILSSLFLPFKETHIESSSLSRTSSKSSSSFCTTSSISCSSSDFTFSSSSSASFAASFSSPSPPSCVVDEDAALAAVASLLLSFFTGRFTFLGKPRLLMLFGLSSAGNSLQSKRERVSGREKAYF